MYKNKKIPYLLMLPSMLILTLFIYYPLIQNFYMSLFRINYFQQINEFIWFKNYLDLFQDKTFWIGLKNNMLYAFFSVFFQVGGGLVLAAILSDKLLRFISPLFRIMYFIPVLISTTTIGLLFTFIYSPEGMLNQLLILLNLDSLTTGWLGNSKTAIYAIIAVSQWQNIGYIMILFIVAMQKIPDSIYEAADLDGASKITTFLKITVPLVKETMLVALVITLSGAFLVFNEIYILTGGGPGDASTVLSMHLFNSAFIHGENGYASSIASVIFIITLSIALFQIFMFQRKEK